MKVEEAIIAATINAAYAINRGNLLGSVQVGKQADLLIFNIPSYEYLVYQFGINKPTTVIKKGKIVYKENQSAN
jgi:imidazolonepropionase